MLLGGNQKIKRPALRAGEKQAVGEMNEGISRAHAMNPPSSEQWLMTQHSYQVYQAGSATCFPYMVRQEHLPTVTLGVASSEWNTGTVESPLVLQPHPLRLLDHPMGRNRGHSDVSEPTFPTKYPSQSTTKCVAKS